MTKIALDTNAYGHFMAGNQQVLDYILEAETIYVSTIVLGELFAGFVGGTRYIENKSELKAFLAKPGVAVVDVTMDTSEIYGEIKNGLTKKGKMIPLNDIWIAAHAMETGAKLVTYDGHFLHIPGLRLWEEVRQAGGWKEEEHG